MAEKPSVTGAGGNASAAANDDDYISEAALEHVLLTVPSGALALASLAVGTLVLGWLAIYFLVFLPRGPIG